MPRRRRGTSGFRVGRRQQLAVSEPRGIRFFGRSTRTPGQTARLGARTVQRTEHGPIVGRLRCVETAICLARRPCERAGGKPDQLLDLLAAVPGLTVFVFENILERARALE